MQAGSMRSGGKKKRTATPSQPLRPLPGSHVEHARTYTDLNASPPLPKAVGDCTVGPVSLRAQAFVEECGTAGASGSRAGRTVGARTAL